MTVPAQYKETSVFSPRAIGNGIDAAAGTATTFIAEINGDGVFVHQTDSGYDGDAPTDSDAYGVHITDTVDLVRAGRVMVSVTSTGTEIYDESGNLLASFGSSIRFASDKPQYIGDEDAYIYFDGAGNITIGGSNVTLGGSRTLSELLAAYDTAALSVVIESSAGSGFVNQSGSTTLTCRVYQYGDTELDRAGSAFSYLWSTGATTKSITVAAPASTATYECEVTVS